MPSSKTTYTGSGPVLFDYVPTPSEVQKTREEYKEAKIEQDYDELRSRLLKAFTGYVANDRHSSRVTVDLAGLFCGVDVAEKMAVDLLPDEYNTALVNRVLTISWGSDSFTPFEDGPEIDGSSVPSRLSIAIEDLRDEDSEFSEEEVDVFGSVIFDKPRSYENNVIDIRGENLPDDFMDRFLILRTGSLAHPEVAKMAFVKLWKSPPEDLVGTYAYFMNPGSQFLNLQDLQDSLPSSAIVHTVEPGGRLEALVEDYDYESDPYGPEQEIVILHEDCA